MQRSLSGLPTTALRWCRWRYRSHRDRPTPPDCPTLSLGRKTYRPHPYLRKVRTPSRCYELTRWPKTMVARRRPEPSQPLDRWAGRPDLLQRQPAVQPRSFPPRPKGPHSQATTSILKRSPLCFQTARHRWRSDRTRPHSSRTRQPVLKRRTLRARRNKPPDRKRGTTQESTPPLGPRRLSAIPIDTHN